MRPSDLIKHTPEVSRRSVSPGKQVERFLESQEPEEKEHAAADASAQQADAGGGFGSVGLSQVIQLEVSMRQQMPAGLCLFHVTLAKLLRH